MCTNESSGRIAPNVLYPFASFAKFSEPSTSQTQQQVSVATSTSGAPANIPTPLDQYRLQLYNYALAERLRYTHPAAFLTYPTTAAAAAAAVGHLNRAELQPLLFASYAKFDPRLYRPQEEPKPQHSYIGLIAMAILSCADQKLVLSDIYQYILDNYAYFRTRGPGWRNSIRHNLSLNDCFIKAGRSANGKGHYWAIHPANIEDFKKGDFRRRKAQRKVRKHMGLAVDEEDSPTPPASPAWNVVDQQVHQHPYQHQQQQLIMNEHLMMVAAAAAASAASVNPVTATPAAAVVSTGEPAVRKRLFDVASLLGEKAQETSQASGSAVTDEASSQTSVSKRLKIEFEEDVDVVSEDHDDSEDDAAFDVATTPEVAAVTASASSPSPTLTTKEPLTSSPPPSHLQSDAAVAANGGLWRSVYAAAAAAATTSTTPATPFNVARPTSQRLVNCFNGFNVVHSPFLPASISSMEHLTKYYEHVAEAMRINQQPMRSNDPQNTGP